MKEYLTFGISVRGPGHIKTNTPNQDSYIIRHYKDGIIMAVSDGVGSRRLSDIGSAQVCRSAVKIMREFIYTQSRSDEDKYINFEHLFNLFHAQWKFDLKDNLPGDCCAAVLLCVVTKDKILFARLGDGCICSKINGSTVILSDDKSDSFSNISNAMHCKFDYGEWEIREFQNVDLEYISLATDGISDDIKPELYPDFSEGFVKEYSRYSSRIRNKKLYKLLAEEWPVPMHTDDKTIACLYHIRDCV